VVAVRSVVAAAVVDRLVVAVRSVVAAAVVDRLAAVD